MPINSTLKWVDKYLEKHITTGTRIKKHLSSSIPAEEMEFAIRSLPHKNKTQKNLQVIY